MSTGPNSSVGLAHLCLREQSRQGCIRKERGRCEREANGKDGVYKASLGELASKSSKDMWQQLFQELLYKKQMNTSKFWLQLEF
jgi:hypothetical protein